MADFDPDTNHHLVDFEPPMYAAEIKLTDSIHQAFCLIVLCISKDENGLLVFGSHYILKQIACLPNVKQQHNNCIYCLLSDLGQYAMHLENLIIMYYRLASGSADLL